MKDWFSGAFAIAVWLALTVGWILNIVKMVRNGSTMETWEVVLRVLGALLGPVGGLMGLFW